MDIRLLAAVSCLALAGCTVGPDYKAPETKSPESWFGFTAPPPAPPAPAAKPAVARPSIAVTAPIEAAWWHVFADPELDALVARAASANLDLRTAALRLSEAREQGRIAGAALYPTVNANGSYTREKPSAKGIFSAFGGAPSASTNAAATANGSASGIAGGVSGSSLHALDLFGGGFDASWEIDLWGRVRRSVESAEASVAAGEQAARGALVSVLAEVARDYVQLRGIQSTLAITRDNLGAAQSVLRLTQSRAAGGLTTELDVANARAQAANVAAQVPMLEQQENAAINQLSLLLGEAPGALRTELAQARPVPPVPPQVPVGVPSDLLLRRPDIAQAEAQLHAATADIGVATGDFYPRVTLAGSFSLQALQFHQLASWDARQYAIGPSISVPLFEGGRLRATLELRKAQQQEAAVAYQKTVLQAWHEVANAIDSYDAEQRRGAQLQIAVTASRQAEALARQRYEQGIADFLQVLDAQRSRFAAEQQMADSTTNVSANLVALYKALGGGWDATQAPESAAP